MLEQVKILSSRRAYEFGADAIRLTTLSTELVQQQIKQIFGFQSSAIGSPMPTFGAVPATYPPGIVLNLGVWIYREAHIVPIRFLHFEQNRIVIDVAGPTGAIDDIADRLFHLLSSVQAADGSPIIGHPARILDYSEITARYSSSLDSIFSKSLRRLLNKTLSKGGADKFMTMIPVVAMQTFPSDEVLPAVPSINEPHAFSFTLRSGTRPSEHIYFSGAPLDSEAHLSYLNELEAILAKG